MRRRLQERYAGSNWQRNKAPGQSHAHYEDEFMIRLRKAVEKNLGDEDFDVTRLCRALGMSRTQLHRKITALTNRRSPGKDACCGIKTRTIWQHTC